MVPLFVRGVVGEELLVVVLLFERGVVGVLSVEEVLVAGTLSSKLLVDNPESSIEEVLVAGTLSSKLLVDDPEPISKR